MAESKLSDIFNTIESMQTDITTSKQAIAVLKQEISKVDELISTADERFNKEQEKTELLTQERDQLRTQLEELDAKRQAAADETANTIRYSLDLEIEEADKGVDGVIKSLEPLKAVTQLLTKLVEAKEVQTKSVGTEIDKLYHKDSNQDKVR